MSITKSNFLPILIALSLANNSMAETNNAEKITPTTHQKHLQKQRIQKLEGIKLKDIGTPQQKLKQTQEIIEEKKQLKTQTPLNIDLKQVLTELPRAENRDGMTLLKARELALKNNLNLNILNIDPAIAQTRVHEEKAKFDQIIFANARYGSADLPAESGDRVKFSSTNPALNNQTVKLTKQAIDTQKIEAEMGISIPLRSGAQVRLSTPLENIEKNSPFSSNEYRTGLRFSISQPLLRDAGRKVNEASITIAQLDYEATRARTRLQSIRVLALVEKAYWNLNQAWTELDIRRQQYEIANQNLGLVKRRVEEGLSAAIELNRAEFGVTDRIEQLIIAKTNLGLAQRQLHFLLNQPENLAKASFASTETAPDLTHYTFNRENLVQTATENRLELLETELKLSEDLVRIDLLKNQTLPMFMLDYSYGALSNSANSIGSAYGQTGNGDYRDWYLGLRFEMPVTNEARLARLQRAVEQRQQRLSTKELQLLTVQREIYDNLDVVEQQWQRIGVTRQQVGIAGMNYDAELKQFNEGLRTMTEVLEMLTRLGDAQIREIRAVTDYQASLVDLAFATGTVLGYSQVDFESKSQIVPP